MARTLAIMVTFTTYGTWLRGDRRGWVDDGQILPPEPELEAADRGRLKHPPYLFPRDQLLDVGRSMGESLVARLEAPILALHVGTWHVHLVAGVQPAEVAAVAKCAKDAVRFRLLPSRPIWTAGYDKRYCFDAASVRNRIDYVERHNVANGWRPRPWNFITSWESVRSLSPRFFKPGAPLAATMRPRFEEPGDKSGG
jgi:hypothetical protein